MVINVRTIWMLMSYMKGGFNMSENQRAYSKIMVRSHD